MIAYILNKYILSSGMALPMYNIFFLYIEYTVYDSPIRRQYISIVSSLKNEKFKHFQTLIFNDH